ncbi:hypothetical protein [Parafrankia sp. FMc2]|uniref:hypothetical protein n=1 Tax=Parafrankia sp. FMc2 TaxID=3233196 RepID=UPI0034D6B4B1
MRTGRRTDQPDPIRRVLHLVGPRNTELLAHPLTWRARGIGFAFGLVVATVFPALGALVGLAFGRPNDGSIAGAFVTLGVVCCWVVWILVGGVRLDREASHQQPR